MDRREFIASATALAVAGSTCALPAAGSATGLESSAEGTGPDPAGLNLPLQVPAEVQREFDELLAWMQDSGWNAYLRQVAGLNLDLAGPELERELSRPVSLSRPVPEGFADFAGGPALQPGDPTRSLLYHALASPLVKLRDEDGAPASPDWYPAPRQLDVLENYIYALAPLTPQELQQGGWVLAVFAYEYRPAIKTPHGAHADFVYSRTGVSRVGNRERVWDAEHRCHTNLPRSPGAPRDIAVTPARFALFLARPADRDRVSRIGKDDDDGKRKFLLPVRKVFTGDRYLGGGRVVFAESHRNEKLRRLTFGKGVALPPGVFDTARPPFVRTSCTATDAAYRCGVPHDSPLVELEPVGSAVLLAPAPGPLVRPAMQGTQRLRFGVPPEKTVFFVFSNRRYTTLKLSDRPALDLLDLGSQQFRAPRNTPLFANIRYQVSREDGTPIRHLGADTKDFESQVDAGGYWAGMFEDGLCDGCVHAAVVGAAPAAAAPAEAGFVRRVAAQPVLPAFSVAAAPDFFPMVDGGDLTAFQSFFQSGGPDVLSAGRLPPNPHVPLPSGTGPAFPTAPPPTQVPFAGTAAAVVSRRAQPRRVAPGARSYPGTNTLPDSASNVFFPGWDITYSGGTEQVDPKYGVYYATFGLGSPFPEDTKLCAAANGMWPGSSPDAARTFHGTLESLPYVGRPTTSVPLVDHELGFHPQSPAVRRALRRESRGWDGEQGPFLETVSTAGGKGAQRRIVVNFTDIGRSDYVANALSGSQPLDAAVLRDLTSAELIQRMEALDTCIRHLPGLLTTVKRNPLWLVSAEKVADWGAGAEGIGIPAELFPGGPGWATASRLGAAGSGYLYAFVEMRGKPELTDERSMRRRAQCKDVFVCQVAGERLAWTSFKGTATAAPAQWRVAG